MIKIDPLNPDPELLRRAFGCFPSGVVAVAALEGDAPVGMTMSSFTSVSLSPPLASLCVQEASRTWPRLRACQRLGVSILAQQHDDTCIRLSSKGEDRFSSVYWEASADGSVFIQGAAAWLDCRLYDEIPAGDHQIVLLAILGVTVEPSEGPLVFHASRFRSLAAVMARQPAGSDALIGKKLHG
jgi:flavin reductase (DIM6/NTAB) family NADH-FMN oxidoreductase RutF